MKKLFTLALSAVALMALSACGEKFDNTVLANPEKSYHLTGDWDTWSATEANKMEATSVAAVAKLDKAVAKKLAGKPLKYLYSKTVEFKDKEGGWEAPALVNGEVVQFNSGYTVKVIDAVYDEGEGSYGSQHWIPDPGDSGNSHLESLTDNLFVSPTYDATPDENGFSWAYNPVITSGAGKYTIVIAEYTTVSSATTFGYGMAAILNK